MQGRQWQFERGPWACICKHLYENVTSLTVTRRIYRRVPRIATVPPLFYFVFPASVIAFYKIMAPFWQKYSETKVSYKNALFLGTDFV